MSCQEYEALIIGQGLAGCVLAQKMVMRGLRIRVIDDHHRSSSSIVAAGIINPITGRRFVKSWMYDTLSESAINFYSDVLGLEGLLTPYSIYWLINSAGMENDWLARSSQSGWSRYMRIRDEQHLRGIKSTFINIGQVDHGYTLQMGKYMNVVRTSFETDQININGTFNCADLHYKSGCWKYSDNTYKSIIFCEGAQIINNPYFKYLPMVLAKGELLIIKSNQLNNNYIIKGDIMLVPMGNNIFWVGATYEWDYMHDLPSKNKYQYLIDRLDMMLDHSYEIIMQSAALRPTVKDRRPILGQHPSHGGLYVFNGMGTKGASLAPFMADHLLDYMYEEGKLMKEVNIRRFNFNQAVPL